MTGISIGLPVFLGLVLDILFEGRKKKRQQKPTKKKSQNIISKKHMNITWAYSNL